MNFSDQIREEMKWCAEFDRLQCFEKIEEFATHLYDEKEGPKAIPILIALLHRLAHVGAHRVITKGNDTIRAYSSNSSISGISDISDKQLSLISDISDTTSIDPVSEEFAKDFTKLTPEARELVTRWNSILSLPRVETLRGRVTVLNRSMRSQYFRIKWKEGFTKLISTPFLTGKGRQRWKASIDWFMTPPNLQNIINGQYDDKRKPQQQDRKYEREEL